MQVTHAAEVRPAPEADERAQDQLPRPPWYARR